MFQAVRKTRRNLGFQGSTRLRPDRDSEIIILAGADMAKQRQIDLIDDNELDMDMDAEFEHDLDSDMELDVDDEVVVVENQEPAPITPALTPEAALEYLLNLGRTQG